MRTEEVADGSRLLAATRYESLVGVSNAIGTHRYPKELFSALVRELHRVVTFHYVGVFIHDKKSNTFHDHFVDAETEAVIPRDPDLAMEDTDAWWVYHNQQPMVTSLDAEQASQQQLIKKNERLELLLELTNHVLSNLEFRDLLRAAVASVRRVMGCDGVGITLPDTDNIHLRIYALDFPSSDGSFHEESLVPINEDLSGEVFRAGKLWCGSLQEARRLGMKDASQTEVGTVCILPLVSRGRVLGIFGVVKYQDNAFTNDDIEFLTQIANQVAIAVENALAFGQIRELKDKLAQEKLYLEDEIRSEMNFAQIVGKSASLRRVLKQVETVAP